MDNMALVKMDDNQDGNIIKYSLESTSESFTFQELPVSSNQRISFLLYLLHNIIAIYKQPNAIHESECFDQNNELFYQVWKSLTMALCGLQDPQSLSQSWRPALLELMVLWFLRKVCFLIFLVDRFVFWHCLWKHTIGCVWSNSQSLSSQQQYDGNNGVFRAPAEDSNHSSYRTIQDEASWIATAPSYAERIHRFGIVTWTLALFGMGWTKCKHFGANCDSSILSLSFHCNSALCCVPSSQTQVDATRCSCPLKFDAIIVYTWSSVIWKSWKTACSNCENLWWVLICWSLSSGFVEVTTFWSSWQKILSWRSSCMAGVCANWRNCSSFSSSASHVTLWELS